MGYLQKLYQKNDVLTVAVANTKSFNTEVNKTVGEYCTASDRYNF